MMTDRCIIRRILADDLLFPHRQAEHIMAMPATQRRWTASEVRQLIADSPLQTPRYELVDRDARIFERWRLHAEQLEVIISTLEWHPSEKAEPFRLDLPKYFAAVFREHADGLA